MTGQEAVSDISVAVSVLRSALYPVAADKLEAALDALVAERDRYRDALDLVDSPYPLGVFPERTDEQRDAIFAAMREVDQYATEWFYAHVARERARVARAALAVSA